MTEETMTNGLKLAANKAELQVADRDPYFYPFQRLKFLPGVVPEGATAPVLAMDYAFGGDYCNYLNGLHPGAGFPGYQYLAQLGTRAEFRAMSNALSGEMTREWIEFVSSNSDESVSKKLTEIEEEFQRLNVQNVIRRAVELDASQGMSNIFLDVGNDREVPLIINAKTVKQGSFRRICNVEATWMTPSAYNSLDPLSPDFYKPSNWYVMGKKVDSSRLLNVVTNELSDILKPAFNFGGISLYQLAERYVDNWLRTQQSVADLVNNFSTTGLKTAMSQTIMGADNGDNLFARAKLFTLMRSNKGLMLLDKDTEELVQQNVPLSGLDALQAQAQEHMCSVSRMPAIILTGISPGGLNASSDSEIRVFYDWIASQQKAFWRKPIETILKLAQLNLWGEIDPSIDFKFRPLGQLTEVEKAEVRAKDAASITSYVTAQVISQEEARENLAHNKNSGFNGIDVTKIPEALEDEGEDNEEKENDTNNKRE
jgi:hypothetical protein